MTSSLKMIAKLSRAQVRATLPIAATLLSLLVASALAGHSANSGSLRPMPQLQSGQSSLQSIQHQAAIQQAATASSLSVQVSPAMHLVNPTSGIIGRVQAAEAAQATQQQLSLAAKDLASPKHNMEQECAASGGFVSFELITGYVLSAPAELMLMQPGTIQLSDCLSLCRQNSSCLAVNFETGLCVLLQESADKNPQALQKSQFPVFTIYAHKICLQGDRSNRCHKSWSFERVIGWVLTNMDKKTMLTKTRLECLQACYNEQTFQCKSFNYDSASGSCQLMEVDRHSLANSAARRRHYVESQVDTIDYGENNCVHEVRGICDFKPVQNRILKTVDSIYHEVKTDAECRKRCLQASYRCHSYDLGDQSNPVCRTSHLDRNSLQQIQDPYLDISGATSYELDSCYNVTVSCRAREMVARVKTNKLFNGKIYAKNAPLLCQNDVTGSMDFELTMPFGSETVPTGAAVAAAAVAAAASGGSCAIQRSQASQGMFSNEIVIQHNDMVVTNADMGLNVKCQYDLRNQTVYNNINLDDFMSGREPIDIASQSAIVKSPNISMQILRSDGGQIAQAQVGDPLMLRFQIADDRSPFEIFVRDLYAMDGVGGSEIMLIDAEGCPTDPNIMAAMAPLRGSHAQTLEAQFDAFKFPTSETVAFRALVTPCVPRCEPVHCQSRAFDGTLYEADSMGRRKRRRRRSIEPQDATGSHASLLTSSFTSVADGATPTILGRGPTIAVASSGARAGRALADDSVVVRNSIEIRDRLFGQQEAHKRLALSEQSQTSASTDSFTSSSPSQSSVSKISNLIGLNAGLASLIGLLLVVQSVLVVAWVSSSRHTGSQHLCHTSGGPKVAPMRAFRA